MKRTNKNIRERIIAVSNDMFARFGFRKTTMDEIASALNKGKSSIYNYFESKEDIFLSVVEKELQTLKTEILNAINEKSAPQEKLRTYFFTRMHYLNRLVNYNNVLKDEYFEHYTNIEKIRKNHDLSEINMIKNILQEGVEQGYFAIKDSNTTASAIFTALKGLEYSSVTEKDTTKITETIENLLEILYNGINKK